MPCAWNWEEGNESIEQSRSAFDLERVGFETQIANLKTELTATRRQLDTQQAAKSAGFVGDCLRRMLRLGTVLMFATAHSWRQPDLSEVAS